MAHIGIVGGGVAGLSAALALGRSGHRVTLFERDPVRDATDPHDAFTTDRRGAPQVRHSHAFLARLRNLLRDEYPDVLDALHAAGATDLRFGDGIPPSLVGFIPEPGDEDLALLACRRTTFEWVLRRAALAEGGVEIRGGVDVAGLDGLPAGPDRDVPQITGVRLSDGSTLPFDLTAVASGRRGTLPDWIAALGGHPVPELIDETGIVYYSRFYRLLDGQSMPPRTGPIGGDLGYLKYGIFAGDNGTFSLTLAASTEDSELRKILRDEAAFDATGRALTFTAPYLDGRAEPMSEVHTIAGLISRWRDYVVDGCAVARGVVAIGDAHLATNPLYGRGCTTGFVSAHLLAQSIRAHTNDLDAAVLSHQAAVERELKPWVMSTINTDIEARRVAAAILAGEDPDADQSDPRTFMRAVFRDGLAPALRSDAVVLRAFMRSFNLLTLPDALQHDADVGARIFAAYQERDQRPPEPNLGPGRPELLVRLAAA